MMPIHRIIAITAAAIAVSGMPILGASAMSSSGDGAPDTSGSSSSGSGTVDTGALYAQAQAAVDAGSYEPALAPLQAILDADPMNADALNLLGYASRSLLRFNEATGYYEQALAIDPEHLGANEYYGELMLTLGNLPAAEERLAVLDEVCFLGCDEFDALETAIESYMTAE